MRRWDWPGLPCPRAAMYRQEYHSPRHRHSFPLSGAPADAQTLGVGHQIRPPWGIEQRHGRTPGDTVSSCETCSGQPTRSPQIVDRRLMFLALFLDGARSTFVFAREALRRRVPETVTLCDPIPHVRPHGGVVDDGKGRRYPHGECRRGSRFRDAHPHPALPSDPTADRGSKSSGNLTSSVSVVTKSVNAVSTYSLLSIHVY